MRRPIDRGVIPRARRRRRGGNARRTDRLATSQALNNRHVKRAAKTVINFPRCCMLLCNRLIKKASCRG
jgi:hypothetical protein